MHSYFKSICEAVFGIEQPVISNMLHVLADIWSVDVYLNVCVILYSG